MRWRDGSGRRGNRVGECATRYRFTCCATATCRINSAFGRRHMHASAQLVQACHAFDITSAVTAGRPPGKRCILPFFGAMCIPGRTRFSAHPAGLRRNSSRRKLFPPARIGTDGVFPIASAVLCVTFAIFDLIDVNRNSAARRRVPHPPLSYYYGALRLFCCWRL